MTKSGLRKTIYDRPSRIEYPQTKTSAAGCALESLGRWIYSYLKINLEENKKIQTSR